MKNRLFLVVAVTAVIIGSCLILEGIIEDYDAEKSVTFESKNMTLKITSNEEKEVSLVKWADKTGDIIIPDRVKFQDEYYNITYIEEGVFKKSKITGVALPNWLEAIGPEAFKGCKSLEYARFNKVLNKISYEAFQGCKKLENAIMGDMVDYIGEDAFKDCKNLKTVVISDKLTHLGQCTFMGCDNIEKITMPISINYTDSGGEDCYQFTTKKIHTMTLTAGKGKGVNYGTSYSHDILKTPFFKSRENLTTLVVEKGVTKIGTYTFYSCYNLKNLTLPDGLEWIGKDSFHGCRSLVEVYIPDSVKHIGEYAFQDCSNLVKLKLSNSLTYLDNSALSGCSKIRELTLPVSLDPIEYVDNYTFKSIKNLERVTFTPGTGKVFDFGTSGTKDYKKTPWYRSGEHLKTVIIKEGVEKIGSHLLHDCKHIVNLTIPSSVTDIHSHAFHGCGALEKIQIFSELNTIGDSAFESCGRLTELEIPKSVVSIGAYALKGCKSLDAIIIPDSVKTLGKGTFENCKGIKELSIPISLDASVNDSTPAFKGCEEIENVILTKGTGKGFNYSTTSKAPWQQEAAGKMTVSFTYGTSRIGDWMFRGSMFLEEVYLPETVKELGRGAFEGCTSLKTITLVPKITTIPKDLFKGCSALETMIIPDTITSLDESCFEGCINLKELTAPINLNTVVKNNNPAFKDCNKIEKVTLTAGKENGHDYGDNTYTPWRISNETFKTLIISDGIKVIGDYTFKNCSSLSSVTLPDGLTTIKHSAFEGCSALESLEIPDTVTELGRATFKKCTGLTNLTVPISLDTVVNNKDRAFEGCNKIDTLTFTKGNGEIQEYKLDNKKKSTGPSINKDSSNTVTDEKGYVSYKDTPWYISKDSLKNVTFKKGVQAVGEYTFKNCENLENVTFPDSLTTIGCSAFEGCKSMKYLVIPDNVTSMGKSAFKNCQNLIYLKMPISLDSIVSDDDPAFEGCRAIEQVSLTKGTGNGYDYKNNKYTPWAMSDCFKTLAIRDGVKHIGKNMFKGCDKLTFVQICEGLESIGEDAFSGIEFYDIDGTVLSKSPEDLAGCKFNMIGDKLTKKV